MSAWCSEFISASTSAKCGPRSTGGRSPARSRFADAFLNCFYADWLAHGQAAIKSLRDQKPTDYVRIAAAILPKVLNVKAEPLDALSDAELSERIAALAAELGLEIRAAAPPRRAGGPRDPGEAGG